MILDADSEAMMTRTRLPMPCYLRGGGYVEQCSAGVDRGHSTGTQWPVTPAAPGPGQYGVDVTSCPIDHSTVSSHCPAEIAKVVDALMERDALSGRLVEAEATGCCRAGFERDREPSSRPRLYARGLGWDGESVPHRGPSREASREAEAWQAAETSRARPGARWRSGGLG